MHAIRHGQGKGGRPRAVLALSCVGVIAVWLSLTQCETHQTSPLLGAKPRSGRRIEWQAPIEVARGRAHAGPWRMNESDFDYVDDASVAVRQDGTIGVVWVDNDAKDVFFRAYARDGDALTGAIEVSRSPTVFSWLPRLVMAADGEVFVLWQEIVFSGGSHGGDIFFARSRDDGRSFATPLNLSHSQDGDGKGRITVEQWDNGSLDLARSPEGALFAAWTTYEGALSVSRSSDGGNTWAAPARIAGDQDLPARAPALAVGGGALYLAWTVGHDPEADIRVTHSADAGRSFGAVALVSDGGGYADAPKLAVDGGGVLHLCYTESWRGFFAPHRVRYARRGLSGGFEASRVLAGSSFEQDGASFPALAVDRAGNVYIAWEHHPNGDEPARGLGFAYSDDGGRSFTSPQLIPGTSEPGLGVNGSRQGKLMRKLAVDASGLIAVVDSRFRRGELSSVRLIRGR